MATYQTDVGMTGDYNSVIGMDISNPIHSFTKGLELRVELNQQQKILLFWSYSESK